MCSITRVIPTFVRHWSKGHVGHVVVNIDIKYCRYCRFICIDCFASTLKVIATRCVHMSIRQVIKQQLLKQEHLAYFSLSKSVRVEKVSCVNIKIISSLWQMVEVVCFYVWMCLARRYICNLCQFLHIVALTV